LIKNFIDYHGQLTGETQLRARRTRIKILKAIADRNGLAGFSDIKTSTGLSTGSIYYHLERMGSYVTKDSKHYMITEEGLQFLREADPKYTGVAPPKEEQVQDHGGSEETVRQVRYWGARRLAVAGAALSLAAIVAAGMLSDWQMLAAFVGINAGIAASLGIAAALLTSLLVLGRHSYPMMGYRGTVLSALALGVVLASVIVFSSPGLTGAAPAQPYDNSMDALRSSYSMHWQIR
jgi:predicted transcriptional regulator